MSLKLYIASFLYYTQHEKQTDPFFADYNGISSAYSQEKLEVERAIIIKNSEDGTPTPGTIRFNPSTNNFEGWNGIYWASLTGNQYEIGETTDHDGNIYPTIAGGRYP